MTAFLNAKVRQGTRVLVVKPEGFGKGDEVRLLKGALYALRKSRFCWLETFADALKELGFEPLVTEMCIFKNERTGA